MGARKRLAAEKRKEEKKQQYFAVLRNCPTSPRKMRLVADMIRGMEVNKALGCIEVFFKRSIRQGRKTSSFSRCQLAGEKRRSSFRGK